MVALEFKSPTSRFTSSIPADLPQDIVLPPNINALVQNECLDRNLLTLTTSIFPVLRMIPALILTEEDVDEMLAILKESIKVVAAKIEATGNAATQA
jgi:4-aminobutyrate aminotransferase